MLHPNRPALLFSICAIVLARAAAQEPVPVLTGIQWLDWATEQVAFTLREAAPPDDVGEGGAPMPVLSPTHSIETIEMMRLQQEVRLLRELIEEGLVTRVMALESEVRELRAAVTGQRPSGPVIPQPAPRAALPVPGAPPEMEAPPAEVTATRLPAPETFTYTVVDEWGRSPEVAAELGGNATSLIGIAGLVSPGSRREDVLALAAELRAKYADYDNVVIEIFDSEAAAEQFAGQQTVNAERRVLSISKAKADGRDIALYFGGEIPEPVPVE